MNSDTKKTYDSAVDTLLENIKLNYSNWTTYEDGKKRFNEGLHMKSGRKFDKVIAGSSVWGFIAKTDGMLKGIPYFVGDVFKAASWSAPAKHVRGSIFATEQNWFGWTGPNYL